MEAINSSLVDLSLKYLQIVVAQVLEPELEYMAGPKRIINLLKG